MGTHPIFESDFDCLTEMILTKVLAKNRVQTPFNVWMTQFLGGRTGLDEHYMRYTYEQAPRTSPARNKPPGQNERLHTVAYIYRDERRKVMPPQVVCNAAEGLMREVSDGRPTPGFGLKWSLNQQEPNLRSHTAMGMKNIDVGYTQKEFYNGGQ